MLTNRSLSSARKADEAVALPKVFMDKLTANRANRRPTTSVCEDKASMAWRTTQRSMAGSSPASAANGIQRSGESKSPPSAGKRSSNSKRGSP